MGVEFRPNDGSTFAHMTPPQLPALVPIFSATSTANMKVFHGGYGNAKTETGFNYTDGISPLEADIKYAALSPAH